jgi:arylsulfatase A-like enzyme
MADTRPNVLWICTDQQRWDTVRSPGNPHIRTPSVDRLVAEGVAFTRCYAQSPICTPSRASFLTGYYPSTLHVNRNGNAFFPCPEKLITRKLADASYDCGLAGKLHLAAANQRVEPRFGDGYRFYFVRCEYHDAMPFRDGDASHANMIFDGRHKLAVYHGHRVGELYDLQDDPHEFRNLWDEPAGQAVKWDLMKRVFDAVMLATDPGQPRVGYY